MKKHNIAILYGGRSGEHEVSLMSASSVEKHLDKKIYNIHLIGITPSGSWFYQKEYSNHSDSLDILTNPEMEISLIPNKGFFVNNELLEIDFIFPILHGTFGEDGTIQGLLELMNIPYAGSCLDGSFIAMDKEYAKILWQNAELPVVPFLGIKKHLYLKDPESIKRLAEEKFNYPQFIKPVQAGSSVGVSRVNNPEDFHKAVKNAFKYDVKILIEQAVDAREIECSVIGNNEPVAFSLGEIAPSHEFYDYDAKYLDPNGAKLIIPAKISPEITQKMKELAIKAYSTLNIKGFSRVDFFLDKKTEQIMINEINTIPGFTKVSMFSMLCAQDGLDYETLLNKIFQFGIDKHEERESLIFSNQG